jgi:hypothetical protein
VKRTGPRQLFLIAMALVLGAYAHGYTTALPTSALATVDLLVNPVPIEVYAALFYTAAGLAVLAACVARFRDLGFVAVQFVTALWCVAYIGTWLHDVVGPAGFTDAIRGRGWVPGVLFLGLSVATYSVAVMRDRTS